MIQFEVGKSYNLQHVIDCDGDYVKIANVFTVTRRSNCYVTIGKKSEDGTIHGTIKRKIQQYNDIGEVIYLGVSMGNLYASDVIADSATTSQPAEQPAQKETAPASQPEQESHEEEQPEIANSLLNADTFNGKSFDEIKQAFAGKTVKQLKVIALCYLIPYYSSMRKSALIEAIASKISLILECKHRDFVETVSGPEGYNSQQDDFTPEPVKPRSIPDLPAHFASCEKAEIKFEVGTVYKAQDTGGSLYPIEIISRTAQTITIKFTYTIGGLWADTVDVKIEGFTEKAICHTTNYRAMSLSADKIYHSTTTITEHDSQPEQDIPAEHEPDAAPVQTTPEPQPQPQITRFETGKTYIGVFSYKTRYWGEAHPHTNHSKSLYTIIARNDKRVTVRSQLRKLDGQYTEGEISQRLIHVTDNGIEYINPEGTYGAYKRYFLLANAPTVKQEDTTPEPQPEQPALQPQTPENAPSVRLTSSTPKPQKTRKPRKTANDENLDHSFIECKDLHGLECSNAMRHNRQLVKAFMFIEPLIAALLTLSKQTIIFLVNDFGCGRLIKGKKKLELVTAFAKELFRRRDYEQSHTPSQPVTPKPTTTTPQTPKQEVKCDKKRQLYFSFEFDEEQSAQEKMVA